MAVAIALGGAVAWSCPYRALLVTGASMSPTLEIGDVCIVDLRQEPQAGSVVLIRRDGWGRVIHRVVACDQSGFVTRGDANNTDDRDRVGRDEIAGVVLMRLRLAHAGKALVRLDMSRRR